MSRSNISFKNRLGHLISAILEEPIDQHPIAYALFAHCFTCSKNLNAVTRISKALADNGWAIMRFDFTGLGESEGEFSETNFSSNIDDLVDAANFLKNDYGPPSLLIGHSLGGAAVLAAVSELPFVNAVATIAAPADPEHVANLFENDIEVINQEGEAKVNLGGRPFTIKKQFIDDLEGKNILKSIRDLRIPLLIMHSPQDNTVGIENAQYLYEAALHPKSFISLDGADHLLTNKRDAEYVGESIACWAKRYVKTDEPDLPRRQRKVLVHLGVGPFTADILAGKHHLKADEPESIGGNDYGPSPYDLLLASLGTCTAMTMKMYANRKGWKIEEINVHLDHAKGHLEDCENCENANSRIDVIEKNVQIKGDLDEKQISRLMEIADRCPVHKTLNNPVDIRTSIL